MTTTEVVQLTLTRAEFLALVACEQAGAGLIAADVARAQVTCEQALTYVERLGVPAFNALNARLIALVNSFPDTRAVKL